MTQRAGRKTFVPQIPEKIESGEDRGIVLKAWLEAQGLSQTGFAQRMGISRTMLIKYLNGTSDIAGMTTEVSDKLLRAMGISDQAACELLNIPPENRSVWRSLRPWPLGPGDGEQKAIPESTVLLDMPLFGSVSVPAGSLLCITPPGPGDALKHQIYQLPDGRYYAVETGSGLSSTGQHLGGLASVQFSTSES